MSFLCREIKPRYHFCAINGTYFECPPFRMPKDETTQFELCTRFISLADVGNAEKAKYIYALSLKPVDKARLLDLVQKTTNEIACPFIGLQMEGAIHKNDSVGEDKHIQYRYHSQVHLFCSQRANSTSLTWTPVAIESVAVNREIAINVLRYSRLSKVGICTSCYIIFHTDCLLYFQINVGSVYHRIRWKSILLLQWASGFIWHLLRDPSIAIMC